MQRMKVLLGAWLFTACAGAAWAADGVIEINQVRALAGGVTENDQPGYPVTIDEPGSYLLTGDLSVGDPSTHAVLISAPSVDLDLNGFAIAGPNQCSGEQNSIQCSQAYAGGHGVAIYAGEVTVRNGSIHGAGGIGVYFKGGGTSSLQLENLRVFENSQGVVIDEAHSSSLSDCFVYRNLGPGVSFGSIGGIIEGTAVYGNGSNGIALPAGPYVGVLIQGSSVNHNGGSGIGVGSPGHNILGNTIAGNTDFGIKGPASFAYGSNNIHGNGGTVDESGVQVGTNVCNGSTRCP